MNSSTPFSENAAGQEQTRSIGVTIALASWTMMFLTIFWGYLVYRWRTRVWLESYLSSELLVLGVLNTLAIVISGYLLRKAVRAAQEGKAFRGSAFYGALALGVAFLIGQAVLWGGFMAKGLTFRESLAGNFFFLLTGFHAVHIIGGLIALLIAAFRGSGLSVIKGVKAFWDFLAAMWLVIFALIFIIR